jgi:arabinofuranan 3-O-arabinosyltransferase
MWIVLTFGLLALPFLSLPGRYVFDTRDSLWLNPTGYLARALVLWRGSPYLGHQQHDGILFPMGVAVWMLRSIGLSAWVAERLWHGFLLLTTAGSTILLVDALRGRRAVAGPVTAGLLYSLTPYTFGYGLQFTAVFLPYALLPLLLLVTLRGIERKGFVWPALFGLTTFAMGGGNGAPQAYGLAAAAGLWAWIALIDRRVSLRSAARFAGWSLLFVVGLNLYWLFLLGSSEVSNALAFSEQPYGINISSSASETIRGLGFWQFYGGDRFGPWIPSVRTYVTSIPLLMAGFAVPLGALVSAWLVRWKHRLFFLLLLVVSVFVGVGIFQPSDPTPFGRALLFLYGHVPGTAGLRTTYKAVMVVNLCVAVLAGIGIAALWDRLAAKKAPRLVRTAALLGVVLVVGANAYPLWAGRLYNPAHGLRQVPGYWRDALNELDLRDTDYRAFFAPATSWATYRWGAIKEGITATDPGLASISPIRLPIGERFGSNLVAAVEQPYLAGRSATGSAQLFRYLGVRDVVLQNDIDWVRANTAGPSQLKRLLGDHNLVPAGTFGTAKGNVQVLSVRDPIPMVRAESPDPVILSGDGFGMADAAREGLLQGGPPVLYSGTLTSSELQTLIRDSNPRFLITDSNRRVVWYFTGPRAPHSYTLPAGQSISGRDPGYLLFDDRPETQSVAVYPGARAITASGYGSVFRLSPQYRPANAFDGDPATWWVAGIGGDPTGAWIQAVFPKPLPMSSVTISSPNVPWLNRVERIRLEFSDGTSLASQLKRLGPTTIRFRERVTATLRVRIVSTGFSPTPRASGAAIGEIQVPGLRAAEIIQVPNDLMEAARQTDRGLALLAGQPIRYLFERARIDAPGLVDEETGISRRFQVPDSTAYILSGTVHIGPNASDDQIDELTMGRTATRVTSSSRYLGNPRLRGSSAFDRNPRTSWVPAGGKGQWVRIEFPSRSISRIVLRSSVGPKFSAALGVNATFSDGSVVHGNAARVRQGVIDMRFTPRVTSSVTVTIDRVYSLLDPRKPISIKEIEIPEVAPLKMDDAAVLPCSMSSSLTLDGAPLAIQPAGTVGHFLGGSNLPLQRCGAAPVSLKSGWHNLLARGGLQPDTISLATPGWRPPKRPDVLPSVSFSTTPTGGFDVAVRGATDPYYLVMGQNMDRGWRATINGRDLGPPILLDGYSAGWRIDRPGSYSVAVRYGPQRIYSFALILTGATLLVAVIVLIVSGYKGRSRGSRSKPWRPLGPTLRHPTPPQRP